MRGVTQKEGAPTCRLIPDISTSCSEAHEEAGSQNVSTSPTPHVTWFFERQKRYENIITLTLRMEEHAPSFSWLSSHHPHRDIPQCGAFGMEVWCTFENPHAGLRHKYQMARCLLRELGQGRAWLDVEGGVTPYVSRSTRNTIHTSE
jgi:hypothetical protein